MTSLLEFVRFMCWGSTILPPFTKNDEEALGEWLLENGFVKCQNKVVCRIKRTTESVLENDDFTDPEETARVIEIVVVTPENGEVVLPYDEQNEGEVLLEKYRIKYLGENYALINTRRSPWTYSLYEKN